jgi:hypothetical protein
MIYKKQLLNSFNTRWTINFFYRLSKKIGIFFLNRIQYEFAYFLLEYAGSIARRYPILASYSDDELEESLKSSFLPSDNSTSNNQIGEKGKVVFYNSQIVDKGALTQQYLDYLIQKEYEILLIIPDKRATVLGESILDQINNYPKGALYISEGKRREKIQKIHEVISGFDPEFNLIHLSPEDVIGFTVFSNFSIGLRFYIVHNDHTFWLGKKCADYFLEFRPFGVNIATSRRKIPQEKIILNKYYPIIDEVPFQGFPEKAQGKVIGFLAANLYKLSMDKSLKFLTLIATVLKRNPNFLFMMAGYGNGAIIFDFIKKNNLEDQFIFLGKRKDFAEVVSNIDILIGSYPLCGGLVTQYAATFLKPIISFSSKELFSLNYIEDLLLECNEKMTYTNETEFVNALENKISHPVEVAYTPTSSTSFNLRLDDIFQNPEEVSYRDSIQAIQHDDTQYLDFYLNNGEFIFLDFLKNMIKFVSNYRNLS